MKTPRLLCKRPRVATVTFFTLASLGLLLFILLCGPQQVLAQADFDFINKTLQNASIQSGTSLEFGPDDRLYVTEVDGDVKIFTIERSQDANGVFSVTATEEINFIQNIPNHNDNGSNSSNSSRQVTGITVVGTAENPVMYVTSTDNRIGAGGSGGDANLDTNSGVITRATWNGSGWDVVDIVRGLPRSEENHATNGLEFVLINNIPHLIVCSGGFTNAGSPSNNFAFITEYALSGAVLAVNLDMINSLETKMEAGRAYLYDLPTLDDPTRPNLNGIEDPNTPGYDGVDVGDPWGGNDGLNQSMLLPNEPVQMFSPGYRNTYDLVVTESGGVYVTDNGANTGWGGFPENEATPNVTNNYRPGEPGSTGSDSGNTAANPEPKVNNEDHLNLVTTDIQNYNWLNIQEQVYGGHPCPVRANVNAGLFTLGTDHTPDPNGYFRTVPYSPGAGGEAGDPGRALPANWPPVDPSLINTENSDFRQPDLDGSGNPTGNPIDDFNGKQDNIIVKWPKNTNAIDEYTATNNFGGELAGSLIAGKNGGTIWRIELSANGMEAVAPNPNQPSVRYSTLASGLGGNPLGITCQGDDDIFPGTIWIANFNGNGIIVLEPTDFGECIDTEDPLFNPMADYDFDMYSNQDEIDNGTDYCSPAFTPEDFDGDFVSNLNDSDDDNDNINDDVDPLQIGVPFELPIINEFRSDEAPLAGIFDIGITGLMSNDDDGDWEALIGEGDILGGTSGIITIVQANEGDALTNDQKQGYQFGVLPPNNAVFAVLGSSNTTDLPNNLQSAGNFIGDGFQDNYIKVVRTASDGDPSNAGNTIAVRGESNGAELLNLPSVTVSDLPEEIFVYFIVDPTATPTPTVQVQYSVDEIMRTNIGDPIPLSGNLLTCVQDVNKPLVVGIIANDTDPNDNFSVSFDKIAVFEGDGEIPIVVGNIDDQESILGDAIDLEIPVNGGEGAYTVTPTNLPPGLSIDVSSGMPKIMGTITTAAGSPYNVSLLIDDADGNNADAQTVNFVWTVSALQLLYRVNAGGSEVPAADGSDQPWEEDTTNNPSPYWVAGSNNNYSGNNGNAHPGPIIMTDPSIPPSAPAEVFNTERWDQSGGDEMKWEFPVGNGNYQVNLLFSELFSGIAGPGERVFDVNVEGTVPAVFDNLDAIAIAGPKGAFMRSYTTEVTDGSLTLEFIRSAENPAVKGIEIYAVGEGSVPDLANLTGTFDLQGLAPGSAFSVDVTVDVYQPNDPNVPVYSFTPTASYANSAGTFTVTDMAAGTYLFVVKTSNTLQQVESVTLAAGNNTIDFGTLLGGDANNDNQVTINDFSLLATTFNLSAGESGYDPRADFNLDGQVNINDFSLLATNFNVSGENTDEQ